jgi:hypothetical protein
MVTTGGGVATPAALTGMAFILSVRQLDAFLGRGFGSGFAAGIFPF